MFGLPDPNDRTTVYISPDKALYGVEGAREVFAEITSRPLVTTLILNHHELADEGVSELCRLLTLPHNRRYSNHIAEIDLGDNCITDNGLEALSSYLSSNKKLKKLILQRNKFSWEQTVLNDFVTALNESHLETLTLNTVPRGDIFVPYIFAHLITPYLKTLRLAVTDLTEISIPAIVDFISSPRCRLHTLVLNGNSLPAHGLNTLVAAMSSNFTLSTVEIFGNLDSDEDVTHIYPLKRAVEGRNRTLRERVVGEALTLLRTSRILLLQGGSARHNDIRESTSRAPTLPVELQQHILSFTAPHLSTTQRLRIFNFASDSSTLPPLASTTPASCLPDPSAMPLGPLASPRRSCENGTCMGASNSISCKRENLKEDWLFSVGCDVPDPVAMTDELLRAT